MTLPMAAWRVTYTPGNWLVLSGPTMLVVMLPAPARMSGLVNSLWDDVVQARSVDGLLELLTSYGLDNMPDFAAFFWDAEGLHGLARGRIKVVDTDTGEDAVTGEGVITWREESLGAARHLRVDMEPVDQDAVLQLPLVVGAASASAIYLTTDAESVIRFPTYEQLGILPKVPALGVRPRDARRAAPAADGAVAPVPEAEGAPAAAEPQPDAVPDGAATEATDQAPAPAAVPADTDAGAPAAEAPPAEEPPTALPAPGPEPEPAGLNPPTPEPPVPTSPDVVAPLPTAPDPGDLDPDAFGTGALAFETEVVPAQPPVAPFVPPVAPAPGPVAAAPSAVPPASVPTASAVPGPSAPVVVPGNFSQPEEDDGGTIFSTGLAATHKPATQSESAPEAQVLALPCTRGHANAPGARHCRLCSSPVDSSNARLIRRPALAGVNSNQGDFADINVAVVVGRAPDASKGPPGSHLMRVPSPSSDISRSHLLVQPRDWSIIVTDLNSTNGTTVLPVGEQPFVLANGDSVQVELGTVLDLGDGVSLRIEPPRG